MTALERNYSLAHLREDLVWANLLSAPTTSVRPAVFLDRDGVVIEERGYLSSPNGVTLIAGAAESIGRAAARGYMIVIVSNQSGIGRGFFDWNAYKMIEERMFALLADCGAYVDLSLACAHHPDGLSPYNVEHPWRKPEPGMLLEARRILNLDLERSLMVGDKASDIAAARAAGLRRAFLTATGHGKNETNAAANLRRPDFCVSFIASIDDLLRCDETSKT